MNTKDQKALEEAYQQIIIQAAEAKASNEQVPQQQEVSQEKSEKAVD